MFEGHLRNHSVIMKIPKKVLRHGVTNCSSGQLCATSNIKNREIEYDHGAKYCYLRAESGEFLIYKRGHKVKDLHLEPPPSPPKQEHYVVAEMRFPDGCHLDYTYNKNYLERVTFCGNRGDHLSHIILEYPSDFASNPQLSLSGEDGGLFSTNT